MNIIGIIRHINLILYIMYELLQLIVETLIALDQEDLCLLHM